MNGAEMYPDKLCTNGLLLFHETHKIKTQMKKNFLYEETLTSTLEALGVTIEELRGNSRETTVADARSIVAALLKQNFGATQVDIAAELGVTQVAVSKMLARHRAMMLYNAPYRRKWQLVLQHSEERRCE